MKNKTEIKLGLLVVVVICVGYWGINFLRGKDIFNSEREYFAVYKDLSGLKVGAPVLIKGYKVGQVREIVFLDEYQSALVVKLAVDSDYPISVKSTARIFSADLMGTKAIELKTKFADEYFSDGDTLPSEIEGSLFDQINLQMTPIKAEAEKLMGSMGEAINVISEVFNQATITNLQKSFSKLNMVINNVERSTSSLSTMLEPGKGRLSVILANVDSISTNLKDNNKQITAIIENFATISDTLAQAEIAETINSTGRVMQQLDSVLMQINRGDGSLGQLIYNDTLYTNLEDATKSLDNLLIDLKENPKRYVHFSLIGGGGSKKEKKD